MKDVKMESGKNMNAQNPEFIKARRKLDRYAFDKTLEEYKKDNTIDFQKRKDEIIKEELLELKKRMQERKEKDLLSGINKLVDRNSDIDARYRDLVSEEAEEKLYIREKANEILEQLKKEQKEKQSKKVKPSVINKDDEIKRKTEEAVQAKKIEDFEAARKRSEALRRASHNQEKKRYEDRQGKVANLVEQLAFINKTQNEPTQSKSTNSIQNTQDQNPSVRSSNIKRQPIVEEKVVIKETISSTKPTTNIQQKPQQALVPKKQKSSFIERIRILGNKSV